MTRHLPEQTRREQILSAARKCFVERGYHPTRMEDIAATAGLSKGGVYFHFDSKREVFDALVEEEYQRSLEVMRDIASEKATIPEKMQRLASTFVSSFSSSPDSPRFFIVMGEMALRDEAMALKLRERQTHFIDEIARLLEQGVAEGFLRPIDSKVMAAVLKALIDGVEGLSALQYPVEMSELLATGLQLVMGGIGRTS
jgi:AcrR family transcriptional regulator